MTLTCRFCGGKKAENQVCDFCHSDYAGLTPEEMLSAISQKRKTRQKHLDGTPCLEGTQEIPKGFEACCSFFEQRTKACTFEFRIEWFPKSGQYGVVLPDRSYLVVEYCPSCGTRLVKS